MVYILAFSSTHMAMEAQAFLKADRRRFVLIPTPRYISAGCGMALRFEAQDLGDAEEWLEFLKEKSKGLCVPTLHKARR